MKTVSSVYPQSDSSSNAHSILKTVGAVLAALVTWIFVATVLNLPLRAFWPHDHAAATRFNFPLTMKPARLALGAASPLTAGFVAKWIGKGRIRAATLTG